MTKSPIITVLMALLILNAAASAWFSLQFGRYLKRVQVLQYQRNLVNRNMTVFQALFNDTMVYSQRNPAIDPLLQSFGLKDKSGAQAQTPKTTK